MESEIYSAIAFGMTAAPLLMVAAGTAWASICWIIRRVI